MKPIISSFPQPELNHVDEIFTEGLVVPDGDKRHHINKCVCQKKSSY
jgi:hypothetical protein